MTAFDWLSVLAVCAILFAIIIFINGNGGGQHPKF